MNAIPRPQPFTALNIRAVCGVEGCSGVTIIGFREGVTYGLLARYEFPDGIESLDFPYPVRNYELHWLTKDGRFSEHATGSAYDLRVVRDGV